MTTSTLPTARAAAHPLPLSIRVLRRLHPLVVAVLGSPLHGLLSRDVLLLHYRGRRSGRAMTLPLSWTGDAVGTWLCTRPEGSVWWKNLAPGPTEVEVTKAGRRRRALATVLPPDSPEALHALRLFLARNPRTGRTLYDVGSRGGRPVEADLAREVLRSTVVRLDLA